MRQIMFLKSEKTIVLEIYEVLRVLIKYNGITRNNKEENIKFYRVVRVIPKKNYKSIKLRQI